MIPRAAFWEAACTECAWIYRTDNIRSADFRAELHSTSTGHRTDVDQSE